MKHESNDDMPMSTTKPLTVCLLSSKINNCKQAVQILYLKIISETLSSKITRLS